MVAILRKDDPNHQCATAVIVGNAGLDANL